MPVEIRQPADFDFALTIRPPTVEAMQNGLNR
jgi:hypothetical protein